jgi:carboxymethylenebutenolidase
MASSWVALEVDGSRMDAYVAAPTGDGPYPGVVVGMHAFGVDKFIQGKCDELAASGYVVIAPYLYHRQKNISLQELIGLKFEDPRRREVAMPMKDLLRDDEIQRDVLAALDHLKSMPSVSGQFGITGFCIGGRVTYLMAVASGAFDAAAVFYGTDVNKSWGHDGPSPLALSGQIRCPLVGFFGNEDTNPSPADVDEMEQELERQGVPHAFYRYDGAPHAFNDPFNPVRWTPAAAADAWPRLLDFFRRTW